MNCVAPGATNWNPEFTPLGIGVHGAGKVDCVTEWFLARNVKMRLSPALAVTLDGVKAKEPFEPTEIGMSTAIAEEAAARVKRAVVKSISDEEKCNLG